MKKILILICILVFGVASLFAGEAAASETPQAAQPTEATGATAKNLYLGGYLNLGMSKLTAPDDANYSADPGFAFGIHFGGNYYFSSNFGLNFSIGYERLAMSRSGASVWSHIIPINLGGGLKFGGFYTNFGISLGLHAATYIKIGEVSAKQQDSNTLLFGFYLNPGYRISVGSYSIPVGLEFKYYLTSVSSMGSGNKWWQLTLKIGFEF